MMQRVLASAGPNRNVVRPWRVYPTLSQRHITHRYAMEFH